MMPETFIEITSDQGRIGRLWWINSNLCPRIIEWRPGLLERWVMWGGWGWAFEFFRQIEWTRTPVGGRN